MILDMIYLLLNEANESHIVRNTYIYITSPKVYRKILHHRATSFPCIRKHARKCRHAGNSDFTD